MSFKGVTVKIEPEEDSSYLDDSENQIPSDQFTNDTEYALNLCEPEFVNIKSEPDNKYIDIKIEPVGEEPENNSDDTITCNNTLLYANKSQENKPVAIPVTLIKPEPVEINSNNGHSVLDNDKIVEVPSSTSQDIYNNSLSDEILDLNSTADGKYICPVCHKRFANKGNVRRHILLHSKESFKCSTCLRKFTNRVHYEKHLVVHSDEKTFKCDTCEKLFRTSSNLEQHRKIHLTVKPHQCQRCFKQFAVKANLLKHFGGRQCKIKSKEPLQCNVCHKIFKREFLLRSHLRRHTTEKPFSCELCKMNFKYKSTLIRHMQLHNGIKPFACKICRKTFTHAGLIKPHMRKHTGEKPYECGVCHRLFAHKHNMQRHELRHEKVKHLVCDICNKVFPKESRLKYHMRIHTKAKPFICDVCGKSFSHKQNIIRHYSRKHPNQRYTGEVTDASFAKDVWDTVVKRKFENLSEEEIII